MYICICPSFQFVHAVDCGVESQEQISAIDVLKLNYFSAFDSNHILKLHLTVCAGWPDGLMAG